MHLHKPEDLKVEVTDASVFFCFKITIGELQIYIHALTMVDLLHKCSTAFLDWTRDTSLNIVKEIVRENRER